MIPDQKIEMTWNAKNIKFYVNKGYTYTKQGEKFEIDVHDLSEGSHIFVWFICDYCNGNNQLEEKQRKSSYRHLLKVQRHLGKNCCNNQSCKTIARRESFNLNIKKNKTTLGHIYPELSKEWSSKNDKTPFDYSYGATEIVWWNCENNHEWKEKIFKRSTQGRGCPYCSGRRVTPENSLQRLYPEIAKEWHPTKNGELRPCDFTKSSMKRAWWSCKKCEKSWEATITNRTRRNSGCPYCSESKGEKRIADYLKINNIAFTIEKTFSDCRRIGLLRFDFAILDVDRKLACLIEYDGIQHFKPSFGEASLEAATKNDKIKNEYCEKNDIPLIRIPYTEIDNIEKILREKLSGYNLYKKQNVT